MSMRTIVKMQFGSHVYGTNVETSDRDFKAVHVPSARDILLQRAKPAISVSTKTDRTARNEAGDTDMESFALQKYMALLLEGQTMALNMLFTPDRWLIEQTPEWDAICHRKEYWLHRGVSAFAGYCRQQANKYGIRGSRVAAARAARDWLADTVAQPRVTKLREAWGFVEQFATSGLEHIGIVTEVQPNGQTIRFLEVCNRKIPEHAKFSDGHAICSRIFDEYGHRALQAETNQGVDWKAMMHAVRVCGEAEELLLTHAIGYPRPNADLLLLIRKGEMPYKEVAEMLDTGLLRLDECQKRSTLPDKPNYDEAEALVLDTYQAEVIGA